MPVVRRGARATSSPMMTTYEAGLSCFPDTDGVHPTSRFPVGRLGMDLTTIAAVIPGGGIASETLGAVSNLEGLLSSVTGGAATDASRQARVNWTVQAAQRGSVLAAEIIMAGPANTAGTERTMWATAAGKIPATVLAQASAISPSGWWPSGQPDFYTDVNGPTHTQILSQVAQASQAGVAIGSGVANGIKALTGTSSGVLLVGVALAGAAFVFGRKKR